MATIEKLIQDETLTLFLKGRIDSSNAAETETKTDEIISQSSFSDFVIDVRDLEYISSAGLRIILRLRKTYPDLEIINASNEVYDIFEMTGFTEMMKISKAYRKLSVEGCEVIGQGANGKVYRLDPDTIIKVYLNPDSLADIHRERELARKAFVLGIPTAIPYDVVQVGEGYGSVFELLNAKSFAKLIKAEPQNIGKYIQMSVDLLKKIHSTKVKPSDMPNMKETALKWAKDLAEYLPEDKAKKLVSLMQAVPETDNMLHGDYHVKNVMLQNGEVLLIDMDTLCYGHPVFEFASIFNAYKGFQETDPNTSETFLGIPQEASDKIWKDTIALYLNTQDEKVIKEIEDKARLIGYVRLIRRKIRRNGLNTEEGRLFIKHYKDELLPLIDSISSLSF